LTSQNHRTIFTRHSSSALLLPKHGLPGQEYIFSPKSDSTRET
jgi:hypothetical protein